MTPSRLRPNAGHRQRLVVIVMAPVLVALYLAFGAAGGAAAPSSPQQQVRAAWARLRDAFVDRNPSRVCGMLTPRARRELVASVLGLRRSESCEALIAGMVNRRGWVSEAADAQLLSVEVRGSTAATLDTTGVFRVHWVRTGETTWKVSAPAPGDLLPFTASAPRDGHARASTSSRGRNRRR
jgi:hypothetical protein